MRTLDDIIPPSRRRETEPVTSTTPSSTPHIPNTPSRPPAVSPERSRFPTTTIIIVLLVIIVSVGALFYFSTAKIEVTPNTVSAAVQSSFTASQDASNIPFEIITAQKIATQSIASTGTKTVNSFASGTLTIYNTQSTAQKLITNTRFATQAGLIFKIHTPITIPGGTTAKPGSVTATVYAAQTGDSYNVGATSFTVPGLAGTPQASQVYARSQSAMTGGASGAVPIVDTAAAAKAKSSLVTALAPELDAAIQSQIPAGFVLLPGSATTTYQELTPTASKTDGMVEVREQGTITAVVFPNAALAKAIATSISGLGYQGEPLTLSSSDGLALTLTGGMPNSQTTSFSFLLSGTASLVYTVDASRIAAAVSGKTRADAEIALKNYPEVKQAILILRPFWRQSFPQDPASISVVSVPGTD